MQRTIHNKSVIARKDHPEMMSKWFRQDLEKLNGMGISFTQWRAIAQLKANGWYILKGQRCNVFVGIDCEGEFYHAYYLPEIDQIVREFDLAAIMC